MKLSEDILVSNLSKYKKRLVAYIGEELANSVIKSLGGDEAVMKASFATTNDNALCYDGAFIRGILDVATYAVKINALLPEDKQVDKDSLVKVILLSQISKVLMFTPNTNDWEVQKRGMVYTFNNLEGALRMGERSLLIAMNAGVKFTAEEFEAMRILDKSSDDDNYAKYHSSMLSTLVKQANEIVMVLNKVEKEN